MKKGLKNKKVKTAYTKIINGMKKRKIKKAGKLFEEKKGKYKNQYALRDINKSLRIELVKDDVKSLFALFKYDNHKNKGYLKISKFIKSINFMIRK